MTTGVSTSLSELRERIRDAAAAALRIAPGDIGDDMLFTDLGMDSLAAAELTSDVQDLFGAEVALTAVHEYPTVAALVEYLGGGAQRCAAAFEKMRADARLPDDIIPSTAKGPAKLTRDAGAILLTGASGFLGVHLVRTLLDETGAQLICLVRDGPGMRGIKPRARFLDNLTRYGVNDRDVNKRVTVVAGDLALPRLGLSHEDFAALAESIDAIIHGGAQVDWVRGYESLRDVNVLGTREILRLACLGRAKPVHFISSAGVCYSLAGPRNVTEAEDALPWLEGLRLGYAQSKCVAEELVREAGRRGLPISIIRPVLVSGDSVAGRSNVDDLLTRFIAGCIELGVAPELDWRLDSVPADIVARAITRFALAHDGSGDALHVAARHPRHWRECVLWMRLCGYDISLLPYREWTAVLAGSGAEKKPNPLLPLRSFFLQPASGQNSLTLPELLEEGRRTQVNHDRSRVLLEGHGIECKAIDSAMLDRYFASYVAQGIIPNTRQRRGWPSAHSQSRLPAIDALVPQIEQSLRERRDEPALTIEGVSLEPLDTDNSIVSELTSWREGTTTGLFRGELAVRHSRGTRTVRVVVKVKPTDRTVIEVAESVAALAGSTLGREYSRHREFHGFTRSDTREVALYAAADPRIRMQAPGVLALSAPPQSQRCILVLDEIPAAALFNAAESEASWPITALHAAIDGTAQIHAVWYGREKELRAQPWLAPVRDTKRLTAMQPLWGALAQHARDHSGVWSDPVFVRIHDRTIEQTVSWSQTLGGLRQCLIHNDFNPRNIAIFPGTAPRLCVFDWELATLGVPQRDLAELLCWTLPATVTMEGAAELIERSRVQLSIATGTAIDASDWNLGFQAALCEYLVDRLAMYAMLDRFRPQRWLPRVLRTWITLRRHYPWVAV